MDLGTRLGHQPAILAAIAAKVLHGHLRHRDRMLEAPPTDLTSLPDDEAELLIRAMIAAAHSDGDLDAGERNRIAAALSHVQVPGLAAHVDQPQCVEALVRRVSSPQQAARFYGVSLIAINKSKPAGRAYLAYLARRLDLPADQVARLNRRLGMPR